MSDQQIDEGSAKQDSSADGGIQNPPHRFGPTLLRLGPGMIFHRRDIASAEDRRMGRGAKLIVDEQKALFVNG